ncbi:hypothetical protein [Tomitella biformata]|uniref:hypothetical protein n=1 Tax=Tomitella biformata TaxID=630403 RepID=UPI00046417DA|nr:hypothetical protein [Tomitella biformata]
MSNHYARIRAALAHAESADPPTALEHLRVVLDEASRLLDEQLASAVLDHDLSLRSAGAKAGLTENAVGPRLAGTPMLAAYARPDGRVMAKDIQRARYDKQTGQTATPPATASTTKPPMRFKPRRNT